MKEPKGTQTNTRSLSAGVVVLVVLFAALFLWQSRSPAAVDEAPTQTATIAPDRTVTAAQDGSAITPEEPEPVAQQQVSDLPPIDYQDLPLEAHDTIALIDQGGPYPYDKDGSTFQNREGLLPDQPQGYYAEYTAVTPGSSDRGARRIVAGKGGEMYYTDDHYESFYEVMR